MVAFSDPMAMHRGAVIASKQRAGMSQFLDEQEQQRTRAGLVAPISYGTANIPSAMRQVPQFQAPEQISAAPTPSADLARLAQVGDSTQAPVQPSGVQRNTALQAVGDITRELSKPMGDAPAGLLTRLGLGSKAGYAAVTEHQQMLDIRTEANRWYNSSEAVNLLASDPQLMVQAQADPVGFHQQYVTGGVSAVPAQVGVTPQEPDRVGAKKTRQHPVSPIAKPGSMDARLNKPIDKRSPVPATFKNTVELDYELDGMTTRRQRHAVDAERALRHGNMPAYRASLLEMQALDDETYNLVGQKATQRLEDGDPRLLSLIYQQKTGQNYVWQRRSDGKLDLLLDGQVIEEGLNPATVANKHRMQFKQSYADGVKQRRIAAQTAVAESQLEQANKVYITKLENLGKVLERTTGFDYKIDPDAGGMWKLPKGGGAPEFIEITRGELDGEPVTQVKTTAGRQIN